MTFLLGVSKPSHKIEDVIMHFVKPIFKETSIFLNAKVLGEWRILPSRDLEPLFTLTNMEKKVMDLD